MLPRLTRRLLLTTALAGLVATTSTVGVSDATAAAAAAPKPAKNPQTEAATILILGDSLSAEYGLRRGEGWVGRLSDRLAQERIDARIVNASISGDTTSGGRSRLPELLEAHRPNVVVIELGANDALRGQSMAATESNLDAMTRAAQATKAKVLLLGMQVPPNYGAAYADQFAAVFKNVAKSTGAALVPFFLAGVADGADPTALFQADRIHPNEEAQPILERNVWPQLRQLIK